MVAEIIRFPNIARYPNEDAEIQRLINEADAAMRAARRELNPQEYAELSLMKAAAHARDPEFRDMLMKKADQAALPPVIQEPSDLNGYRLPFDDRPALPDRKDDMFALVLGTMVFLAAAMAIGDLISSYAAASLG